MVVVLLLLVVVVVGYIAQLRQYLPATLVVEGLQFSHTKNSLGCECSGGWRLYSRRKREGEGTLGRLSEGGKREREREPRERGVGWQRKEVAKEVVGTPTESVP